MNATPSCTPSCSTAGCANPPLGRYTWPGRDEAGICASCLPKLRSVAEALGMHLQVVPLEPVSDDERRSVLAFMGSLDVDAGLAELTDKGRELVDAVALSMRAKKVSDR